MHTNNIKIREISSGSPQASSSRSPQEWQSILSHAVTEPEELLNTLGLNPDLLPGAVTASQSFRIRVPHTYIARMEHGNPDDPLLKQVLPISDEMVEAPGFSHDPLGEQPKNSQRGIIHKYQGRLLLMPGSLCAVNCRFCFRRHFPYDDNKLNKEEWQSALEYIRQDASLKEVILSGGDPLVQNDRRLKWLIEELANIPHLQRLRIHTRLPVIIPQRVTDDLVNSLTSTRLKSVVVIHSNHPNEIDHTVSAALSRLYRAGVQLLNQSTLLKGINDNAETLAELSEVLFHNHVMPYYLHLLDKVQGAAHFEVSEEQARKLVGDMSQFCSGYLVPKLARETAGMPSKTIISPTYHSI
ncbi:EF-P beta-lysylation protein EpmB [Parendozoicomonas haliclonae]|uniref:EF-P beta-lysylation protein EpmB n=1 Tax=Parendozoicomonas haliclonae TaxID=1960125 RepID=UPI0039EF2F9B